MHRLVRFVFMAALLLVTFGCAHNYYNVPKEVYEKKVRVLGIVPVFVDAESDIRHPNKDELVAAVKSFNRKNENALVGMIRETGTYFSVRMVDADADKEFTDLFFRRERRDDAGIQYNKYFFKQKELSDLLAKNNLDAVLVMVVSGINRHDRMHSSNLLKYLDADYNYLILTAQILDGEGTLLWEYPNFRQRVLSLPPLMGLQYPDFDEAAANMDEKIDVKFKTIPGIKRAFEKPQKDIFLREKGISSSYYSIFDDMASMLKLDMSGTPQEKK